MVFALKNPLDFSTICDHKNAFLVFLRLLICFIPFLLVLIDSMFEISHINVCTKNSFISTFKHAILV